MTSKPYFIVVEDGMSRESSKSLLRTCLQQIFLQKPTKVRLLGIHSPAVDAIRVVRLRETG